MSRDRITLSDVSLACHIGLSESERAEPQALRVDLELSLDLRCGVNDELNRTIDYARLLDDIEFIACASRFALLESFAQVLAAHALSPPAPSESRACADAVWVRVVKPAIFGGRAVPSVRLRRSRGRRAVATRGAHSVAIRALVEGAGCSAYHVDISSGSTFIAPAGLAVHVVAGRPRCEYEGDSRAARAFTASDRALRLLAIGEPLGLRVDSRD